MSPSTSASTRSEPPQPASTDDLDALWADLAPVTVEEILGAVARRRLQHRPRRQHRARAGALARQDVRVRPRRQAADLPRRRRRALLQPEGRWRRRGLAVAGRVPRRDHGHDGLRPDARLRPLQEGRRRHPDGDHERQAPGRLRGQRPLLLLARRDDHEDDRGDHQPAGRRLRVRGGRPRGPARRRGAGADRRDRPVPQRHHDEGLPARGDVPQRVRARGRGRRRGGRRRRQRHRRRRPRGAELPVLPHLREVHGRPGRLLRLDADHQLHGHADGRLDDVHPRRRAGLRVVLRSVQLLPARHRLRRQRDRGRQVARPDHAWRRTAAASRPAPAPSST